jgi:endonuclease/exonuclease/phosphatase (EEP) superfamily protein YafD
MSSGLAGSYPHQFYCRAGSSVGNTAILSRRPFAEPAIPCRPVQGFSAQAVDLDGRVVTIASQHLNWPWPHGQWRQIEALRWPLNELPWPVIVGGDFNAAPWSAAVGTYAEAGGLEIARGVGPTWLDRRLGPSLTAWIGLPIDNVLHSPEIDVLAVERLAPTASDHLPVLVTFSVAAPR